MSTTARDGCALAFFRAIFAEDDLVAFRPIEVWNEAGKKTSKVDYKGIDYGRNGTLASVLERQLTRAEETRANIFFGVAPRIGARHYDEAWQIRKLTVLWSDVDGADVPEVLQRINNAGLPGPSIVVASGNGVHVYWILSDPYLIDDVGDPPPVMREWIEGEKKFKKSVEVDGERLYLDVRRNVPKLSAKALLAQDVLKGIATAIGGDHTHDLARILRVPGTLNRKDQRNGKEPVPCDVHSLRPELRYTFELFVPFANRSPDKDRREKIEKVKLPAAKKVSAKRQSKLDELILQCDISPIGQRSEADWAVVCYCIEQGVDRAQAWAQLANVGKFAEQGERYFDTTWEKAVQQAREKIFAKAERRAQAAGAIERVEGGRPTIRISPSQQPVAELLRSVTDVLVAEENCFRRADQLVTVRDGRIRTILEADELAGLLSEVAEVKTVEGEHQSFTPFPPRYASTWLNNYFERGRLREITIFSPNPLYVQDWRLTMPGFDEGSGIYYAGPAIKPIPGTNCLDRLLEGFCFKTPADRTNYIGILLTTLLVAKFIGSKPALLLNGNQPELGKTTLAQLVAIMREGKATETATFNPNSEEFEKRLGAILRRGASTFIIDNAKGNGRQTTLCIESDVLERSITDAVLSYRLLGQSMEIRAENSAIFIITANTAEVSRDIFSRSVAVNLFHEGNPSRRRFDIIDPEGFAIEHRETLLGELAGMVERWKVAGMPQANTSTRFNKKGWGNIVGGILEASGEPDFLDNMDDAAEQMDTVRRDFSELVGILACREQLVFTARDLVEVARDNQLLRTELAGNTERSTLTRMGYIAGRFVRESFAVSAGPLKGRSAVFERRDGRNGSEYVVGIQE